MASENKPLEVLKALELAIKRICRDIKTGKSGPDMVSRLATLTNSYSRLADLFATEIEDKPYNYYDAMNAEAIANVGKKQK